MLVAQSAAVTFDFEEGQHNENSDILMQIVQTMTDGLTKMGMQVIRESKRVYYKDYGYGITFRSMKLKSKRTWRPA